jgi:hypothetical protein
MYSFFSFPTPRSSSKGSTLVSLWHTSPSSCTIFKRVSEQILLLALPIRKQLGIYITSGQKNFPHSQTNVELTNGLEMLLLGGWIFSCVIGCNPKLLYYKDQHMHFEFLDHFPRFTCIKNLRAMKML